MGSSVQNIAQLQPGLCSGVLSVAVDRIIIHHKMHPSNRKPRFMEVVANLDIILRDQYGARILGRLKGEQVMDAFLWMLRERHSYNISEFMVKQGGERVHPTLHVYLTPKTNIYVPFPRCIFNLRCPSDIAWGMVDKPELVDVCGYVKFISDVVVRTYMGILVRELDLILESKRKVEERGIDHVKVILRGSWVDCVKEQFDANNKMPHTFVVVQYVFAARADVTGCPTMVSFADASRVLFNPIETEVQEMKESLAHY